MAESFFERVVNPDGSERITLGLENSPRLDDISRLAVHSVSILLGMAELEAQYPRSNVSYAPKGGVYPITEIRGDGIIHGNWIYPDNFRIPDTCADCPSTRNIKTPQISRVSGLHPVNSGGVIHIGAFADYVSDVLILNDANEPELSPVYLGELPVVSCFSVQHESPKSQVLGRVQRCVDACKGPELVKKFFRSDKEICMAGLVKAAEFSSYGRALSFDSDDLHKEFNIVIKAEEK